jgi:hypothetical protein
MARGRMRWPRPGVDFLKVVGGWKGGPVLLGSMAHLQRRSDPAVERGRLA